MTLPDATGVDVPRAVSPLRDAPAGNLVPPGQMSSVRPRRLRWAAALTFTGLAVSAAFSAHAVDSDAGYDLFGVIRALGIALIQLRWQFTALVIALGAAHYVAATVAARAAAGVRLPLGEAFLVQLAGSAANRITPAGVGGAALESRYFSRRGLSVAAAVGAVVALSVLGALADGAVLALIVLLGPVLGFGGVTGNVSRLTSEVDGLVAALSSPWTWVVVSTIAAVLIGLRRKASSRLVRFVRELRGPLISLWARPRSLAVLLLASGSTTLILGFAFAASAAMLPGPQPHIGLTAILAGFMVGSAAGNAVPVPAGVGSTEAALVAVLVAASVPAAHAVAVVLLFRLITFWAPAAVGVLAARRLRRAGAL